MDAPLDTKNTEIKARWALHTNDTGCLEQILETTFLKTAVARPPAFHLTNQSKTNKRCGFCWRSEDELKSNILLWITHSHSRIGWSAKIYMHQLCWCYRRKKWTQWHEFKSWRRQFAFRITLRKKWIQLLFLQLWENSRADPSNFMWLIFQNRFSVLPPQLVCVVKSKSFAQFSVDPFYCFLFFWPSDASSRSVTSFLHLAYVRLPSYAVDRFIRLLSDSCHCLNNYWYFCFRLTFSATFDFYNFIFGKIFKFFLSDRSIS